MMDSSKRFMNLGVQLYNWKPRNRFFIVIEVENRRGGGGDDKEQITVF